MRFPGFKTFRGYTTLSGTIGGRTVGNCLDGIPAGSLEWYDPRVPIEDGDIALIKLAEPLRGAHYVAKRVYHPSGWSKYFEIATDNPPWRGELGDQHTIVGPLVAAWVPPRWLRWLLNDRAATRETDRIGREYVEQSKAAPAPRDLSALPQAGVPRASGSR